MIFKREYAQPSWRPSFYRPFGNVTDSKAVDGFCHGFSLAGKQNHRSSKSTNAEKGLYIGKLYHSNALTVYVLMGLYIYKSNVCNGTQSH